MSSVLMLGTGRNVKGGITTVVNNYFENGLDNKINLKYIETVNDKNAVCKIIKMIIGFFQYLFSINKYDIVHIHMASRLSVYRKGVYVYLSKKFQKKVILHMHGGDFNVFYENECNETQKLRVKKIIALADKVIVLSEEWKNFYSKIVDPSKIIIMYNSISVPKNFEKNLDTKDFLFLGILGKRKGIYDLIDVFEKIICKYDSVNLFIGGNGEIQKVKNIINEKGLEKNIHCFGWVEKDRKEKLLRDCTFYILPTYNEGMPMSVLEAMAYKNVTISTIAGGIPQIINDGTNGILINPGDKESLYNNIVLLIENFKFRKKLSENGYKTVKSKFNVKKNIENLVKIYNDL